MKRYSPDEAKKKILRYCAYQERSHKEVKNKLYSFGLFSLDVNELLAYLITEGYLNEERFAKTYTGGKFRIKKWGRIKIIRALESHELSKNCIRIGLSEIDESEYRNTLKAIITKACISIKEDNSFVVRDKVAQFAIRKGYEPELVWKEVKLVLPD